MNESTVIGRKRPITICSTLKKNRDKKVVYTQYTVKTIFKTSKTICKSSENVLLHLILSAYHGN